MEILMIFLPGFVIGLIIAIVVWWNLRKRIKNVEKDNEYLRNHLHTNMEVHSRGDQAVKDEIESLKEQNEALRISLEILSQKPKQAQLLKLQAYESTLIKLNCIYPNFRSHWEKYLAESEQELLEMKKGIRPFIKKLFGNSNSIQSKKKNDK